MHLYMLSPKTGLLSEFLCSVLRSSIMICFILCSCIMLTSYPGWHSVDKNLAAEQGKWVSFSTTLPFSAIHFQKDGQCRLSCCNQKPSSQRIVQYFVTELGNGYWDTLDHVQYRLDCLYRVILGCFDAGIVDERVHCSFHFSLVTDPLFSLQSPSRARD